MDTGPKIAQVAALVGDPARANMLSALMDGRTLTATELAYVSGVAPQTASGHLARLSDAGLLALERQGRRRYFRLASPLVARMLAGLMVLAQEGPARQRNLWRGGAMVRHARDHEWVEHVRYSRALVVTPVGVSGLATTFGIEGAPPTDGREGRVASCGVPSG